MPAARRKGLVFASLVSAIAMAAAGLALARESSEKPVLNRAAAGKYVSGTLQLHMKGDAAAVALRPGDYATTPARHVHQARSSGAATFFLAPDGP